jgi:ribosome-associated translation inhibitor RaiA
MKTQFYIRGFNVSNRFRQWLEQPLEELKGLIPITAAAVVLEQRRDDSPAYRVFVSLAIPGPDIHAEARDHTLEAAWFNVTSALRQQIERRRNRRQTRQKDRCRPVRRAPRRV